MTNCIMEFCHHKDNYHIQTAGGGGAGGWGDEQKLAIVSESYKHISVTLFFCDLNDLRMAYDRFILLLSFSSLFLLPEGLHSDFRLEQE